MQLEASHRRWSTRSYICLPCPFTSGSSQPANQRSKHNPVSGELWDGTCCSFFKLVFLWPRGKRIIFVLSNQGDELLWVLQRLWAEIQHLGADTTSAFLSSYAQTINGLRRNLKRVQPCGWRVPPSVLGCFHATFTRPPTCEISVWSPSRSDMFDIICLIDAALLNAYYGDKGDSLYAFFFFLIPTARLI